MEGARFAAVAAAAAAGVFLAIAAVDNTMHHNNRSKHWDLVIGNSVECIADIVRPCNL